MVTILIKNKQEWRAWLGKHHSKEKRVQVVQHKKHTGIPSMSHREAIEEAICFGWIDTTVKRIDERTYARTFAKRNESSRWSTATLGYAKKLIAQKRMTKSGLQAYKQGLQKPVIDHGLPRNPNVPDELQALLKKQSKALKFFESLAPSYRRYYIWWIERAKRDETRKRRSKEVVRLCREGKKPGQ